MNTWEAVFSQSPANEGVYTGSGCRRFIGVGRVAPGFNLDWTIFGTTSGLAA